MIFVVEVFEGWPRQARLETDRFSDCNWVSGGGIYEIICYELLSVIYE